MPRVTSKPVEMCKRAAATACLAVALAAPSWAQMPVTNVSVPIPLGGIPVQVNLNPAASPVGTNITQVGVPSNTSNQQPFTLFGLLPTTASGMVAQTTASYIALVTGSGQYQVFVYPANFVPPQGLAAGLEAKVAYKSLSNGLNQVTSVSLLSKTPVTSPTANTVSSTTTGSGSNPLIPQNIIPAVTQTVKQAVQYGVQNITGTLANPLSVLPLVGAPQITAPTITAPLITAPAVTSVAP